MTKVIIALFLVLLLFLIILLFWIIILTLALLLFAPKEKKRKPLPKEEEMV